MQAMPDEGFSLSRRVVMLGAVAVPVVAGALFGGRDAYAQAGGAQPGGAAMALVRSVSEQLVAIVNGPGSVADKRPRLRQVVDAGVDVDEIGRFCLGRFWRTASAEQQKVYLELFHSVLLHNITSRIGEYVGVRITLLREMQRDEVEIVSSTVERPNGAPAHVDWVVGRPGGKPRIVDLVAEGTSMRLTQRSDYGAFLGRHGGDVGALISAMREQIARNA